MNGNFGAQVVDRGDSLAAMERAVLSALAVDDRRKGAMTVRAILAGMDDDRVLARVLVQGRRTTLNSIRWYRSALNTLEREGMADGWPRWHCHPSPTDVHSHSQVQ